MGCKGWCYESADIAVANADYPEIAKIMCIALVQQGQRKGLVKRNQRQQTIYLAGNYARVP